MSVFALLYALKEPHINALICMWFVRCCSRSIGRYIFQFTTGARPINKQFPFVCMRRSLPRSWTVAIVNALDTFQLEFIEYAASMLLCKLCRLSRNFSQRIVSARDTKRHSSDIDRKLQSLKDVQRASQESRSLHVFYVLMPFDPGIQRMQSAQYWMILPLF